MINKTTALLFMLSITLLSFSESIQIITPNIPPLEQNQLLDSNINIHYLYFGDDNNTLNIGYNKYEFGYYPSYSINELNVNTTITEKWNIENNISLGLYESTLFSGYIQYVSSEIVINDEINRVYQVIYNNTSIILENLQEYIEEEYGELITSTRKIVMFTNSSKTFIYGLIRFNKYEKGTTIAYGFDSYYPMVWNLQNGKMLYKSKYLCNGWQQNNTPISLKLSPKGKFIKYRGLRFGYSDIIDEKGLFIKSLFPYTKNQVVPDVEMIYLGDDQTDPSEWHDIFDVNKDVAFTKDDQFLVTEHKGVPTLFNSSMLGWPLEQYPVPSFMTACTFSPDDKQVYIACEDNKIYVFNVNLNSSAAVWELY